MSCRKNEGLNAQSRQIGVGSEVSDYSIIQEGAVIGTGSKIGPHCLIERNVVIGNHVVIEAGVHVCDGVRISNNVAIGSNVTFLRPHIYNPTVESEVIIHTEVQSGASIGGGAIIGAGITVGANAKVAPDAVVRHTVPANALIEGSPAKIVGYANLSSTSMAVAVDGIDDGTDNNSGNVLADSDAKRVHFWGTSDSRGTLTVVNIPADVPFTPKRFFTVYGVPSGEVRGEHAHKECHQFLICVSGSCSVVLDDGSTQCEVSLDSPQVGLYVPPMIWGTQCQHSRDAVLLVLASHEYDEADYFRNYAKFLRACEKQNEGLQ